MSSGYTPNPDSDEFFSTVLASGTERTGTNWAAGGQTTTLTVSIDAANDQVEVDASDISVANVTLTDGKYAVLVNTTPGTNATNHVIGYVTFDTALAPTGETLAIVYPTPLFSFDY